MGAEKGDNKKQKAFFFGEKSVERAQKITTLMKGTYVRGKKRKGGEGSYFPMLEGKEPLTTEKKLRTAKLKKPSKPGAGERKGGSEA